ncbi:GLPGLI family protein [uncultured Dokdonia sp.]|uniref:GLPGLI family protein n=1 Tax=uncultured Dokdonia sp. TaxID=575653 RepID=UPI00260FA467|nr:GLPGLI family protein [uncultured Dokdonia sp.]
MLFSSIKRISYLLFIFLSWHPLISQTTEVQYQETRNIENQLKQIDNPVIKELLIKKIGKPVMFTLLYSKGVSSYQPYTGTLEMPDGSTTVISENPKSNKVYKNLDSNEFVKIAHLIEKTVTVSDQLIDFKWIIKDEVVSVGDYSCKIAEGVYNEKKITAYFTDQINISEGPDVYQGLPGLIVKLDTSDKTYLVKDIIIKKENTQIDIPSSKESINRIEFEKLKKEQIEELKRGFENAKVIKS